MQALIFTRQSLCVRSYTSESADLRTTLLMRVLQVTKVVSKGSRAFAILDSDKYLPLTGVKECPRPSGLSMRIGQWLKVHCISCRKLHRKSPGHSSDCTHGRMWQMHRFKRDETQTPAIILGPVHASTVKLMDPRQLSHTPNTSIGLCLSAIAHSLYGISDMESYERTSRWLVLKPQSRTESDSCGWHLQH